MRIITFSKAITTFCAYFLFGCTTLNQKKLSVFSSDSEQGEKTYQGEPLRWPNGKKAAIVLSYDDAMTSQIQNVLPDFEGMPFRGTFFLNQIRGAPEITGWMDAVEDGHELGNHSLLHPCPASFGWDPRVTSDNYTVKKMLDEIRVMNEILDHLDTTTQYNNNTQRSYAYPCSRHLAGKDSYLEALRQSGLISYGRGGGDANAIIKTGDSLDFMNVPSYFVAEGTEFSQLKAYVDAVLAQQGLGIFMFHGVGAQWIAISRENHQKLLEYLRKQNTLWVAPFSEVMSHIESLP